MTFDEYSERAVMTAVYPKRGSNVAYAALGLAGESGEVAEKVKKLIRDKAGEMDLEFRESIAKELGDVLWYVAAVAAECDIPLGLIAELNLQKLASRKKRGVLGGSGDAR